MTVHAQRGIDTVLISPQTITDGATVTARLDCRDSGHATIRIPLSIEETTDATAIAISLLESDDTIVTNFATITADLSETNVAAKAVRYEVDLRGRKRYLRLTVTAGTETGSNLITGAIATLSRNDTDPGSTTDMQSSTSDTVVIV